MYVSQTCTDYIDIFLIQKQFCAFNDNKLKMIFVSQDMQFTE